ncbi:MAG TPA: DUF692 domain-containing protein [Polyangiaceae bacterium]|nr:DUF692 domain-containing protein [Polyangiaceae bacterium]
MREVRGVGLGFRPRLAAALLGAPGRVDFVEVVAEACRDGAARREALAVAELWPVVPHGVKLSLGGADGLDEGRAREFGKLARELRAPLVSEHVSFVRAGGREIGHLTELPMTREAVKVVARNVVALRRHLPDVPLLLENVARAFLWADHEMGEGAFYHEIARATGCELLLDVGNLYANARNAGLDPLALLADYPLERVRMVHVAGGVFECGFYYDTHAHPVPEAVFELVERVLGARPDAAVLLERDDAFDDVPAVLAEIDRLRAMWAGGGGGPPPRARPPGRGGGETIAGREGPPPLPPPPGRGEDRAVGLVEAQAELARRLTDVDAGAGAALLRARSVLEKKRADDALPLLPSLGPRVAPERALALGRLARAPRLPAMNAVADAMRIAAASRREPDLARAAARDMLCLRARFAGGPEGPRPRALPWAGREVLEGGDTVWAWKGFGRSSAVRLRGR